MADQSTKERDPYEGARGNAAGWLETITDLTERLQRADEGDSVGSAAVEAVREEIQEGPLSVLVRDSWHEPGKPSEDGSEEYEILLSTGGPALRIWGKLGMHGEPDSAELQMQDWGTPWGRYPAPEATLLAYARCFYFGE